MRMSKPRSRKRKTATRRNPITRAWALYGPGGLIYRGKPAAAQALIDDAYDDWRDALDQAVRSGADKKPPRPRFILVAEMSDGSWLEVNTSTGKLVSPKESPQSRLGLQQRIQALLAGVRSFGGGQSKIVGFTYSPGAAPRVSTASTAPVREIRATMAAPVALGAAAVKKERARYADGVKAQMHLSIEYDKASRVFTVPGAEGHPGFPSRAVAALWRKKILHEGPVRLGAEGGWVVQGLPRRAGAAHPEVFHTYEDAWESYKEWMRQQGEEEAAKKERALALAQEMGRQKRPGGLRAISAKAAAAMHAEGLGLAPATFAHTTEYRGLRMIVSADGWVEIPGLKRKPSRDDPNQRLTVLAPSVEAAKALIDTAREAQAARLGKTVANPRYGRLPRQGRVMRAAAAAAAQRDLSRDPRPFLGQYEGAPIPRLRKGAQRDESAVLLPRTHHSKRKKVPRERPPWRQNPKWDLNAPMSPMEQRWAPPARIPMGMRQEHVARRLSQIATGTGFRVSATFNNVQMYADPGESPEQVLARCR